MKERLQKLISMAGIRSRRAAEELIQSGRVRVNGKVAKVGDSADLTSDVVEVDGVRLNTKAMQARVYYAIHKPRNVLSTPTMRADDERKTVNSFVPYKGLLFSIGRLDADSEGLVVLTNDGELAQKLSHPRFRHTKTYRVVVSGLPTAETLERWERGIFLEEGRTAPCIVRVTKGGTKESVLRIVMTEGKKRQIRRVASILGHPVLRMTRIAIGRLDLGELKPGEYRLLEPEDIAKLSTPAPEIKAIRARKPAAPRPAPTDDALPEYGTSKNDDVRSERQRRIARGEGTFIAEPRRPRTEAERSRRPVGERSDDRPRRPQADDDRPRRPRTQEERPQRSRFEKSDEQPTLERPKRRPAPRSTERDENTERPSRRPARPGTGGASRPPRRDNDSRGKRPGGSRPRKDSGAGKPNSSRPPRKRGSDQ